MPPKTWKTSISALFLVIVHINTVCTYYALLSRVQLCRDYALFWGGTLGQNLLVGGTQTFLRTGATRRQKSGGEEAEQLQPSEEKEEESKSWRLGQGAQCT